MRHGDTPQPTLDQWLLQVTSNDPDLIGLYADQHTWMLAHPCNCEALCTCDKED